MKVVPFVAAAMATIVLIVLFDTRLLLPAPLGRLLSPQHGVWQNAEPADAGFDAALIFPQLKGTAQVYFDERLVPHVFAENDADAYFVMGYLHARFRLWQMELQTYRAGGRLTEMLGDKSGTTDILNDADRYFRRLGMTYAAEKLLKEIEQDSVISQVCNAYTDGINAYIKTLNPANMPVEYKLLGTAPEPWTNLKSALFIKYMAFELAGYETDFEFTNARNAFSKAVYDKMYPMVQDSVDPVVSRGTVFEKPAIHPVPPRSADSLYFRFKSDTTLPVEPQKPNKENGSNNWAVNGKKTKSGYPILCNDPHLGLNLPSLWYEIQLHTPKMNVYGVSFPCAPVVAIGFNDSCAFGVTNAERDVRDYYAIRFKDDSKKQYWYEGAWKDSEFRIETYKIKGKPDFVDTVAYTVFGPVIFDNRYSGSNRASGSFAVRWKAHDPSNELKCFYLLNRANNYIDYVRAIKHLHTPGQNVAFAAKNGDIAIRAQGEFPAKWKRQGDFIMPGTDSSYRWQGMIPPVENPRMLNPERNFVSSANQLPADSTYPYYFGGAFPPYRGLYINRKLTQMNNITPQDMMKLQTDNYNLFAEMMRPVLLRAVNEEKLTAEESKYWTLLKNWNLYNDAGEKGATVFDVVFQQLKSVVWDDELSAVKNHLVPYESTLLEGLLRDTAFQFVDNIHTPQKETLADDVLAALQKALPELKSAEAQNRLEWSAYKDTHISHLLRLPAFSREHINTGGGTYSINATKANHGPSWRMIVQLTPVTEAYGVFPGGQSGNPGSRFYANFIDSWATGAYYPLLVLQQSDVDNEHIKWKMTFSKN